MHAISNIKRFAKATLIRVVSAFRPPIAKALNASGKHYCPICQSNVRRFLPAGDPSRANARCPVCGSLERHRLDWLLFAKQTDLFDGSPKTMLHVAPEKFLSAKFRRIKNLDYLSADLSNPRAMVQMDITNINYPDNTFSVIYCSHVLEHTPNDRKAIAELYRVLRQDGWAVLQVPIMADRTYEDPAIIEPEERKKHFGQWNHVRRCGPDYVERMRSAGFVAEVLRATDLANGSDCARMRFQSDRVLFFCRKPSPNNGMQPTPQSGAADTGR
jgi:SAM-dependent methyltransferase